MIAAPIFLDNRLLYRTVFLKFVSVQIIYGGSICVQIARAQQPNQPSAHQLRVLVNQIQLAVHAGYLNQQVNELDLGLSGGVVSMIFKHSHKVVRYK